MTSPRINPLNRLECFRLASTPIQQRQPKINTLCSAALDRPYRSAFTPPTMEKGEIRTRCPSFKTVFEADHGEEGEQPGESGVPDNPIGCLPVSRAVFRIVMPRIFAKARFFTRRSERRCTVLVHPHQPQQRQHRQLQRRDSRRSAPRSPADGDFPKIFRRVGRQRGEDRSQKVGNKTCVRDRVKIRKRHFVGAVNLRVAATSAGVQNASPMAAGTMPSTSHRSDVGAWQTSRSEHNGGSMPIIRVRHSNHQREAG